MTQEEFEQSKKKFQKNGQTLILIHLKNMTGINSSEWKMQVSNLVQQG